MSHTSSSQALRKLIGQSSSIAGIRTTVELAASFPSTVLIHGESGTGKELVARAIHELSPRSANRFVTIDCTLLHESLFESILFGHEKGSFSGAIAATTGLVRSAEGGTVFLDEIGELPAPEQAKLLRLVQERTVLPVGGTRPIPVDIRFVAATHRDLHAMVKSGKFRADLLYRLDVIRIAMPSLKDRPQDIPLIAQSLLSNLASSFQIRRHLSSDAIDALLLCPWPGNVRQLAATLERAAVLGNSEIIEPHHLDLPLGSTSLSEQPLMQRVTAGAVTYALSVCNGNRAAAARRLGIDRRQLYRLLDRISHCEQHQTPLQTSG